MNRLNKRREWLPGLAAGGIAGVAGCLLPGVVLSPGFLSGAGFQGMTLYLGTRVPEAAGSLLSLLL